MSVGQLKSVKVLLGQVIGTKMKKTAKVRVERLVLDKYIMQYFPKRVTVFAHDAKQEAKEGDVVLVKQLPLPRSKQVKYSMEQIIYSMGNVTDPITGKKCDAYSYWDNSEPIEGAADDGITGDLEDSSAELLNEMRDKDSDSNRRQPDGTPV